jgi:hypothetical protein
MQCRPVSNANVFELVVRYEQRKYIHHQQQNWLSGTTGCNVATVPALNNRSELLAENVDAAKFAEHSHIFI